MIDAAEQNLLADDGTEGGPPSASAAPSAGEIPRVASTAATPAAMDGPAAAAAATAGQLDGAAAEEEDEGGAQAAKRQRTLSVHFEDGAHGEEVEMEPENPQL